MAGCGGSETPTEATSVEEPAVDPRNATADALVETYNGVISGRHGLDDIMPLVRFEGPEQRQLARVMQAAGPFLRLEQECYETFGQCLMSGQLQPPFATGQAPLQITSRTETTADATQRRSNGETMTYDLVFANGRWWIAGSTFQRRPIHTAFENASDTIHMRDSIEQAKALGDCAKTVMSAIRQGGIENASDARRKMSSCVDSKY
jgi:hypothetical protein